MPPCSCRVRGWRDRQLGGWVAGEAGAPCARQVRFLGVSDGNMAEGSLRCDVNVSVRPRGTEKLGTKACKKPRAGDSFFLGKSFFFHPKKIFFFFQPKKRLVLGVAALLLQVTAAPPGEGKHVFRKGGAVCGRRRERCGWLLPWQVEIKNMNSFSAISRAIDFEAERQVALSLAGRYAEVVQETRAWDDGAQRTVSMRAKGGAADYRYFPEPDLPALAISEAALQACAAAMPEVPEQARSLRSQRHWLHFRWPAASSQGGARRGG